VDEIERLGDAKWAEMAGTVELVRRANWSRRVRTLSDEGQLAMEALRQAVGGSSDRAARLDAASQSAAMAEARVMPSLGLFVIIAIALILGLWQVIRTARRRRRGQCRADCAGARPRRPAGARTQPPRQEPVRGDLAIVKMSARAIRRRPRRWTALPSASTRW
jgi:hypothetical protein